MYAQEKESLKKSLPRKLLEEGKSKKDKFIPTHTMQAYKGSRGIAPLILIFGISPLYFQGRTPV